MKICWLLVPSLLAFASVSRADGRVVSCAEQQSTALGQTACELVRALGVVQSPVRVSVSGASSPLRLERATELAERLARAVAGELGPSARASGATDAPDPRARVDRLVLSAELTRDRFTVSAELFRATSKFWDRFRPGAAGAVQRAHATHALDAELASYLPPVPLVLTRIDKARLDEPSFAVACGDVDGDGGLEIVSVGRRRIQLGRIAQGRFQPVVSRTWAELSEVAPHPLKDPLASASLDTSRRIQVGLSDRADGLSLDEKLAVVARFPGLFPWPNAGCVPFAAEGLGEIRARCDQKPAKAPGGPLDAVAGVRLSRRDGTSFDLYASRRANGELSLELGRTRIVVDGAVGAQVALADLDGDGRAELVTTLDTLDPSSDALLVRTVAADGKLTEAFRVPVPTGVRALGACPSSGNLLAPLVVATGEELWVLR